jgi:hypothetical protein
MKSFASYCLAFLALGWLCATELVGAAEVEIGPLI